MTSPPRRAQGRGFPVLMKALYKNGRDPLMTRRKTFDRECVWVHSVVPDDEITRWEGLVLVSHTLRTQRIHGNLDDLQSYASNSKLHRLHRIRLFARNGQGDFTFGFWAEFQA